MLKGGGRLFCGSGGRYIGPGHFGLVDCGDGVQKFSCHYESDLDRGGSVLDIRPILWKDGWPVAGENLKEGTYEIESVRTGNALEMAVDPVTVGGGLMGGGRGGARGGRAGGPAASGSGATGGLGVTGGTGGGRGVGNGVLGGSGSGATAGRGAGGRGFGGRGGGQPIPAQTADQVSANWPKGDVGARTFPYMLQAQQKWTISPAPNAGGYLGAPYFKITVAGTTRTLTATDDGELVVLPEFTGAPEQCWRIEQIPDGTYRIMTKPGAVTKEPLALSAIGISSVTLSKYNPDSDKHRWLIKTP
jgi:arabinan endo-1,5-alpha-L-arabinosidase